MISVDSLIHRITRMRRFQRDIPAIIDGASYLPLCEAKARLERHGYAVRKAYISDFIGDKATGDYRRLMDVTHDHHDGEIVIAHYPGCAVSPPSFAAWIF